jgi:transposase
LVPEVPYAWQSAKESILLPSSRSKRINVLGFLNRQNDFHPYVVEGSVNSSTVIACFNQFSQSIKTPTVVIIDNASVHTSKAFLAKRNQWKQRGLYLYNLSKYSPELNKIEILWRFIKYYWLPFAAYTNLNSLRQHLEFVLTEVGKKYCITFA